MFIKKALKLVVRYILIMKNQKLVWN